MSKVRMCASVGVLASAVVLGAGGAIAGATTPAATPQNLSGIQAKASAAVSLRVNDLDAAVAKVNADPRLGSDSAALAAYLQADIAPLRALGQKISGDTVASTAAADYSTIFTNFRVLVLVLPAAHIAGSADQIDVTTVPKFTALESARGTLQTADTDLTKARADLKQIAAVLKPAGPSGPSSGA